MMPSANENVVQISGVGVHFPRGKKPFPQQLALMAKTIAALNTCENALIESPTGTGKTLALLSCSLSWQQVSYQQAIEQRKQMEALEESQQDLADGEEGQGKENKSTVGNCTSTPPSLAGFKYDAESDICTCHDKKPDMRSSKFFSSCLSKLDLDASSSSDDDDDFESSRKSKRVRRSKCPVHSRPNSSQENRQDCSREIDHHKEELSTSERKEVEPLGRQGKRNARPPPRKTTVFFASRTHSQLSQVARELKRCARALTSGTKMTILGSRMQYCVNPSVLRKKTMASSGARNEECRRLLGPKGPGCRFHKSSCGTLDTALNQQIWDVEDLVEAGKRERKCPYFASRLFATERKANLILCPYNYLLDPSVRSSMGLDALIEGSVVIIDEAHNIDDVSREAASFETSLSRMKDAKVQLEGLEAAIHPSKTGAVRILKETVCQLITWMEELVACELFQREGRVLFSGPEALVSLDERCSLGDATISSLKKLLKETTKSDEGQRGDDEEENSVMGPAARQLLEGLLTAMEFMLSDGKRFARDYKVLIETETQGAKSDVSFNIWCLNAQVGFSSLAQHCRSIILTSGTLYPLASFAGDLGVRFKYTLEASHVIDASRQLWAAVVPYGIEPSSRAPVLLEGTYSNKANTRYLDALGNTMAEMLMHVPNGSLCFFPSYSFLRSTVERWKVSGVWEKLRRAKPLILLEGAKNTKEGFEKQLESFHNAVQSTAGALFICVCRGKLSEGIDFSDASARAVFIIGIPYPSLKDLKVRLKREYQDKAHASAAPDLNVDSKPLTGRDWYSQQAFRALNQAIGRCIRHKNDFGAVIFLDHRFTQTATTHNLSKWIRGWISAPPSNMAAVDSLKAFFAFHQGSDGSSTSATMYSTCSVKDEQQSEDVENQVDGPMDDFATATVVDTMGKDEGDDDGDSDVQKMPGMLSLPDAYEIPEATVKRLVGQFKLSLEDLNMTQQETMGVVRACVAELYKEFGMES